MKRRVLTAAVVALLLPVTSAPATAALPGRAAFAIHDPETRQIYTVELSGGGLTQVTQVGPHKTAAYPRWSPDGERLAYTVLPTSGPGRMFSIAADGSDRRLLLHDSSEWSDEAPDYFPDGTSVAFSRCAQPDPGMCAIYRVGTDGSGLTPLTSPEPGVVDGRPDVSPDGTRIAFTRFNSHQVWVMNADGSDAHPITRPHLAADYPSWSSDGTALTVSSHCCSLRGDVFRLSPDGSSLVRLTRTASPNYSGITSWAPNDRRLAFVSNRDHPNFCCVDLWMMNADGSQQVKVETGLTRVDSVSWRPSSG